MNISFDLDSTLIPNGEEFETEPQNRIARLFKVEKLRKGSPELITYLQNKGYNIHIYTTSYRSKKTIRWMLRLYGVKVDQIINQKENQRVLKSMNIHSSKYPPAFGLDLHIDDSKGVKLESEQLNFNVIIVNPKDNNWSHKIKEEINKL